MADRELLDTGGVDLTVITESTEVLALTRQLVRYRSYTPGAAESAMDFINGWFGARGRAGS